MEKNVSGILAGKKKFNHGTSHFQERKKLKKIEDGRAAG